MRYSRLHDDQVEVATVVMVHPLGHRVELIGVMHVAEQHFWDHLNARLRQADADGETVLLEGIRPSSEEELAALTARQRDGVTSLAFLGKISSLAAKGSGMIFQKDAVIRPDGLIWHNNDFSVAQMVKAHGRVVPRLLPEVVYQGIEGGLIDSTNQTSLLRSLRNYKTQDFFAEHDTLRQMAKFAVMVATGVQIDVIVGARNRYAMSAALQLAPANIVNIWGAGHTEGMIELLQAKGYSVLSTTWVPIITEESWRRMDQEAS